MSVKYMDLEKVSYIPKTEDEDIVIEVKIGDAGDEEGSYAVFLGTSPVNVNAPANIGKKADVTGKETTVSVTIVDVLQETNWTSMTVLIYEGQGDPVTFGPYSEEVAEHLDTIVYILKITHS